MKYFLTWVEKRKMLFQKNFVKHCFPSSSRVSKEGFSLILKTKLSPKCPFAPWSAPADTLVHEECRMEWLYEAGSTVCRAHLKLDQVHDLARVKSKFRLRSTLLLKTKPEMKTLDLPGKKNCRVTVLLYSVLCILRLKSLFKV